MKIISAYKDYYDYLQGIYGIDDKVLLVRRTILANGKPGYYTPISQYENHVKEGQRFVFHIMGRVFYLYYNEGRYIDDHWLIQNKKCFKTKKVKSLYSSDTVEVLVDDPKPYLGDYEKRIRVSNVNDRLDCPIIVGEQRYNQDDYVCYPELKQFNFGKFISAEDMWINLYNWLSREKEAPSAATDKEKILSHGFDLKTSFRNM